MRGKRCTAGQCAHALSMQEPGQERLGRVDARPDEARRTCPAGEAAIRRERRALSAGARRSLARKGPPAPGKAPRT
jgi:hypothetical protein